jgi:hypothetical protein
MGNFTSPKPDVADYPEVVIGEVSEGWGNEGRESSTG